MEYYLLIEVTELSSNEHNTDEPYTLIANWKKSDKKKKITTYFAVPILWISEKGNT